MRYSPGKRPAASRHGIRLSPGSPFSNRAICVQNVPKGRFKIAIISQEVFEELNAKNLDDLPE